MKIHSVIDGLPDETPAPVLESIPVNVEAIQMPDLQLVLTEADPGQAWLRLFP